MSSKQTKANKSKVEKSEPATKGEPRAGIVWSRERIQKAKDHHYYVRIINGRIRQFLLSGATSHWKIEENEANLYLPDVRLLGSEEELEALLLKSDYNKEDIELFIENGYTIDNFNQEKREEFEKELEDLKEFKKSKSKTTTTKPDKNVRVTSVMKNLNLNQKNQNHLSTKKKLQLQKNQIIQEKMKTLSEDYVLDVSSMKDDGTGIKKRKTENVKNQYGNVSKVPIVSSDESKYETILLLLDYSDDEMIELLNDFKKDRNEKLELKKSLKQSSKEKTKPKSKKEESSKESSKEVKKESSKEVKKEVKEKESSKDSSKEPSKESSKEVKSEVPKKQQVKEVKEEVKSEESVKQVSKESPKEASKKSSSVTKEELLRRAKKNSTVSKPSPKK